MSDTIQLYEPEAGQLPAFRITVIAGPDSGKSFIIERSRVIVGRGENTDVRLSDMSVSEFHMEMTTEGQGILFMDCSSRNGIRVAGVRVERGIAPPGCVLTLGMTSLRIELASEFVVHISSAASFERLIGHSPAMQRLYAQLEKLAATELSVLIEGETGTGKELVARALHTASPRKSGPFVVLDCTTLLRELAPSKLFGHEKGAFTGAIDRKPGVFESAHGGVLFLDEIGELPLELQPMLLRVLQEHEIIPVGSTHPRKVNIRVLSATHRSLRAMVNRGKFREDLYYRLVQGSVTVPPLRQRRQDIALLVHHFLSRLPPEIRTHGITADALAVLAEREFPGNVRELQYLVERLAWLSEGPVITTADLFNEQSQRAESKRSLDELRMPPSPAPGDMPPYKEAKQIATDRFERTYLEQLLSLTGNNLLRAALRAGLQRHSLRDLLKKHGFYSPKEEDTRESPSDR